MTERLLYTCEFCGTDYALPADCERCEMNHVQVASLDNQYFLPIGVDKTGYPIRVDIKMKNGKVITYQRRKGEAHG